MLFLLFQLGEDRYVLEAGRVLEVLPLLELKRVPGLPTGVAGVFNYHGQPVPAVDLNELTLGRPAGQRMSTRIILVKYPDDAGNTHPLGLIAEHATEIIRRERDEFIEPGLKFSGAPYLGPVLMDRHGVIQWVRERRLLPPHVRDQLFADTTEPAA